MSGISKEPIDNLRENPKLKNVYSLKDYNYDVNMAELKSLRIADTEKEEFVPDSDDAIVYDPYFASILNENREVTIEGLRFRILREGVIISKEEDVHEALKYAKTLINNKVAAAKTEIISTDKVSFLPEAYLNPNKEMSDPKKSRMSIVSCPYSGGGLFGHNHECFQEYGGGTFRTKGRVWSQSFAVYASMGHSTRHHRKKLGIWFNRDADYIETKMNIFEVEFEDAFGTQIIDLAPYSDFNFEGNPNHHQADKVFDLQISTFTTYPPFIKKLVKARKFKKYDTSHKTVMYGTSTELNLTFN